MCVSLSADVHNVCCVMMRSHVLAHRPLAHGPCLPLAHQNVLPFEDEDPYSHQGPLLLSH